MKRSKQAIHICSWAAGLDYMQRKDQKFPAKVLRVLDEAKRFSVFEATANVTIARMMSKLVEEKFIEVDNSPGYPWSNVTLTEKGRRYLDNAPK